MKGKCMLISTIASLAILSVLIVVYHFRFRDGYQLGAASDSILRVRPKDIKVIAAIGDSITAGFGAAGLSNPNQALDFSLLVENRGLSFAIGGDDKAITLGNFFAQSNPDIAGRSVGTHGPNICTPTFCLGVYTPELDNLNAARTGATSTNLNNQVDYLIQQMKNMSQINYEQDFKLISVMIGANDLCRSCRNLLTADQFEDNLKTLLERIRLQIPRTIVNMYQLFNVSQLYDLTKDSLYCQQRRSSILTSECRCAFDVGLEGDRRRLQMDELAVQYNGRLLKIAKEYRALNSSSFSVIVDPAATGFSLRNASLEYLSNMDCFHPSRKAHELFAIYAWNNLFLPYSQKKVMTNLDPQAFQPNAESFILGLE
jgi:phospholipase B1